MIINNETNTGVSHTDLERTTEPRPLSGGTVNSSDSGQTSDSVTLSTPSDLVQLALNSNSPDREARLQQLKTLVQSNQYPVDASAVSNALITAHLTGA